MDVFDLSGLTAEQRRITEGALTACEFDFDRLRPGLRQIVGRDTIPVEWADLSRWLRESAVEVKEAGRSGTGHVPEGRDVPLPDFGHVHVHRDGDTGHGIVFRRRTLGLAWYSGKVSVEQSLVSDPVLAQEVFLAEAAHMVDFFLLELEPAKREAILRAYHGGQEPAAVGHPRDWFEEAGELDYADWVGEAFMVGFTRATSTLDIRFDQFTHSSTPHVVSEIRAALSHGNEEEPSFVGIPGSSVYHVPDCPYMRRSAREEALLDLKGRRPCRVCKP